VTEIRQSGDRALLIPFETNEAVHAAARMARSRWPDQLEEVVPGHETLLLVWREGCDGRLISDISELARSSASYEISDGEAPDTATVTIPMRYDGPDLEDVAAKLGLSEEGVVELHSGAEYVVAFMGFAPGFPYLIAEQDDEQAVHLLELPRLEVPRTEVPAGSVAVAAGYCGIYPRASPGGWNLLGTTDVVLFDPEREPAALLEPGSRVRFDPV